MSLGPATSAPELHQGFWEGETLLNHAQLSKPYAKFHWLQESLGIAGPVQLNT